MAGLRRIRAGQPECGYGVAARAAAYSGMEAARTPAVAGLPRSPLRWLIGPPAAGGRWVGGYEAAKPLPLSPCWQGGTLPDTGLIPA